MGSPPLDCGLFLRAISPLKQSFAAGVCACLAAVVIWGAQMPVAKDSFAILDPWNSTALRYVLALAVLLPVLLVREGPGFLAAGRLWPWAAGLGVIGMSASPLLVFSGMAMSRAEHAAVIVSLQPSIAAMLQWALYRKRPSRLTLGCIALALTGAVLVITKGRLDFIHSRGELLGGLLILLGAACWVVYTLGAPRLAGWSTWRITLLTMLAGGVSNLLAVAVAVAWGKVPPPTLAAVWEVRWVLVYLAYGGVLFAMLAWNFGAQRIGPLNASLFINFMPVMTFGFRALQGVKFAAIELCGVALVVGALVANNVFMRVRPAK